jgi:hypothetical protein
MADLAELQLMLLGCGSNNLYMQPTNSRYLHKYRKPKEEGLSFFACLNCNRDVAELDESTFSSSISRKDLVRMSYQPQPHA